MKRSLLIAALMAPAACQQLTAQSGAAVAAEATCSGIPRKVVGTVYCDNKFTLWVNGKLVATDPIDFTPHQAVRVEFDWDGASDITYALECEDFASLSGYEYVGTQRPQLGDGALIAQFDDGFETVTSSADWRAHVATFGPTDASIDAGCSPTSLAACAVENRGTPEGWSSVGFDDRGWELATSYSPAEAGWGRPPRWSDSGGCCGMTSPVDRSSLGCDAAVVQDQCLDPRSELAGGAAEFIWGADLERDNRVLFRHTAKCPSSP